MDSKVVSMVAFTFLGLLAAFTYSYFYPTTFIFGAESQIPLSILIILNFFFGVIFFGYLAFIPALIIGLQLGAQKNALIFLYIFPLLISTYAGTKLGFMLENDFWGKKDYLKVIKTVIGILIIALIIAILIENLVPLIIEYWPNNTGFNVQENQSVMDLFNQIYDLKR
jgi:hypothetical protein